MGISFMNWTQELIATGDMAQVLLTTATGKLEESDLMITWPH